MNPKSIQIRSISSPCHLVQKDKNREFSCADFTLQRKEGKTVWENVLVVLRPWRRPNG